MDDRGLLIAFCGSCPSGLRGALKRIGQRPEEPLFYDELFSIFANSAHKSLMHALRHAKRIDAKVVQTARMLPENWRYPALVEKLGGPDGARNFKDRKSDG